MKNVVIIIFALISTSVWGQSDMDKFEVRVDGLGCPFCAYGLEKKFNELKGIDEIKIEMETGVLTFDFPAEEALKLDQVNEQVIAAGYTPVESNVIRFGGEEENLDEVSSITTVSFMVAGNCEMCKNRIELAAMNLDGVQLAKWNMDDKILEIKYDMSVISLESIQSAIAKEGHDTPLHKAEDKVYNELPACCLFERN